MRCFLWTDKLKEFRCELVYHSSYSPLRILHTTIMSFFPRLKWLAGKRTDSNKKIKLEMKSYFEGLEASHYRTNIEVLEDHYNECTFLHCQAKDLSVHVLHYGVGCDAEDTVIYELFRYLISWIFRIMNFQFLSGIKSVGYWYLCSKFCCDIIVVAKIINWKVKYINNFQIILCEGNENGPLVLRGGMQNTIYIWKYCE